MSFLFFIFSLLVPKANYCSCVPLGPLDEKQYKEYDLIVKAKVIKTTVHNFEKTIYLSVDTYYKGGYEQKTLEISTPDRESICGITPTVNEVWLIFAYLLENNYETSLCTRTKNMNSKAWNYNKNEIVSDLKFLEAKIWNNNH